MKNFMLNHLKKKIPRKNQIFKNLARPWQLLVRLSAAIKFLFGFGLFPNIQENENQLIRTKTIGFNWGKNLLIISKGKIFRANYWWAGVRYYVYNTILVITKIYIFLPLYFTSVLWLIIRRQPASNAWTVTSTTAFYHCWSYTEYSNLWSKCVAYISY